MTNLKDLTFVTETPKDKIIVVPALLSQESLIKSYLPEYRKVVAEEYGNNEVLRKLDNQGRGSNPFIVSLTKRILAPYGVRPARSSDDQDGSISDIVKGKYWLDFEDLVVHSPKHTYDRNQNLLRNLIETVEDKVGEVKFPFKVTGLVTELWEEDSENGYGLRFAPAEDFDYVSDKRLNLPTGTNFNTIDEKGIIIPDKNGSRTWYSKENGLSRLCLDRDLYLVSNSDYLANSNDDGRVVLVSQDAGSVASKK